MSSTPDAQPQDSRRPLKSRSTRWAAASARAAAKAGLTPNRISVASVFMAAGGGTCLVMTGCVASTGPRALAYVLAGVFIQLRLLCNLLDGMVAVEGGLKTKSGEIFNDLPDRLADPILFICAGYSLAGLVPHGVALGYLAGLLSVLTAYVRVLGAAAGAGHDFSGPMAKPHRMALLAAACAVSVAELFLWQRGAAMAITLAIICVGCVLVIARRTVRIVRRLESQ